MCKNQLAIISKNADNKVNIKSKGNNYVTSIKALVNIVVSLTCTLYQFGSLIALCVKKNMRVYLLNNLTVAIHQIKSNTEFCSNSAVNTLLKTGDLLKQKIVQHASIYFFNRVDHYHTIKVPHRYAVQGSDTTMLPIASQIVQQKIFKNIYGLTGIKMFFLCCVFFFSFSVRAQQAYKRITADEAIAMAKNNLQYQINKQQINKATTQIKTATVFQKTGVFAENEDLRPSDNKGILKIGFTQTISWPGLYGAQKKLYSEQMKYYETNSAVIDLEMKKNVRAAYYQLWYLQDKQELFQRLDSIYTSLHTAAILKVKTGDSPGLDSIAANVRMMELQAVLQQFNNDVQIQQQVLMQLLNTNEGLLPMQIPLQKLAMPALPGDSNNTLLALQAQTINIAGAGIAVAKNENKPEFAGRFFSQRLWGESNPFTGFSVSAIFPLFGANAYRNKVKVAEADRALQQKQFEYDSQLLANQQVQIYQQAKRNNSMLYFYETTGLKQAGEIIKASSLAYRAGEISFAEFSQYLSQAIEIQQKYLEKLNEYNQSVIQYYYYNNQ